MGSLITELSAQGWLPPAADGDGVLVDYPDEARAPLNEIEDVSAWFTTRNRIIDTLLDRVDRPSALVEIGAGNGSVAAYLQSTGIDVVAVEPGAAGAANSRRRGVVTFNQSLEALHLPDEAVPAIGAFDVLEHLDDPAAVVREAHRVLAPGGLLVLTVPAFPLLWGQIDDFSGHHLRYRLASLDALVEPIGFSRAACSYFFTLGLPFSLLNRALPYRLGRRQSDEELIEGSLRELNSPNPAVGAVIRWAGVVEAMLVARRIRLPLGTSLGAVYRRRD